MTFKKFNPRNLFIFFCQFVKLTFPAGNFRYGTVRYCHVNQNSTSWTCSKWHPRRNNFFDKFQLCEFGKLKRKAGNFLRLAIWVFLLPPTAEAAAAAAEEEKKRKFRWHFLSVPFFLCNIFPTFLFSVLFHLVSGCLPIVVFYNWK